MDSPLYTHKMSYTKLFRELLHSTIWFEPDHIRVLWITMLALKDDRHEVMASVPGLAKASSITREQCEEGLKLLSSPDPDSRSQEHEGRRIDKIKGGWVILNGENYREKRGEAERREYKKNWMAKKRASNKNNNLTNNVDTVWTGVDNVDPTEQNRTEHNITKKNNTVVFKKPLKESPKDKKTLVQSFEEFWNSYPLTESGRKPGKKQALDLWKRLSVQDRVLAKTSIEIQKKEKIKADNAGVFYENFQHCHRWLKNRKFEELLIDNQKIENNNEGWVME